MTAVKARLNLAEPGDNLHPADELARVREQAKELAERENELRTQIVEMAEGERVGRYVEATVAVQKHARWKAAQLVDLARSLGAAEAEIERCRTASEVTTVRLKPLGSEGEA